MSNATLASVPSRGAESVSRSRARTRAPTGASRFAIARAARLVRAGGVIAYPTEAVYGIGCDPLDERAVQRVLELKGRRAERGLIVIAAGLDQLEALFQPLTAAVLNRLERTWPGPVTWVLPARPDTPSWLTGGRDSIALRVTAHPVASALCRAARMPLVSTSANLSGGRPAKTALEVRRLWGLGVDLIVPGHPGPLNRPTEIRDALSGRIMRAGDGIGAPGKIASNRSGQP